MVDMRVELTRFGALYGAETGCKCSRAKGAKGVLAVWVSAGAHIGCLAYASRDTT